MLVTDALFSLDFVAAGVRGGECTAAGPGDPEGDGASEPAAMDLLLGVAVPEAT